MNQNNIVDYYELKCGDTVVREKSIFPRYHAVYVGFHKGNAMVAVNHHERGVEYISLNEFLLWGVTTVKRVQRYTGTEQDRKNIIPNINKLLGKASDVIQLNRKRFAGLPQDETSGKEVKKTLLSMGLLAMLGIIIATKD